MRLKRALRLPQASPPKGRAAISIVQRAERDIEKSYFAMGRALAVLEDDGVLHALGYPSFAALWDALGVSVGQADRLTAPG